MKTKPFCIYLTTVPAHCIALTQIVQARIVMPADAPVRGKYAARFPHVDGQAHHYFGDRAWQPSACLARARLESSAVLAPGWASRVAGEPSATYEAGASGMGCRACAPGSV